MDGETIIESGDQIKFVNVINGLVLFAVIIDSSPKQIESFAVSSKFELVTLTENTIDQESTHHCRLEHNK